MKNNSKTEIPKIISGFRAWLLHKRLILFIFLQMLRIDRNPFIALRGLRNVRKLRRSAHGNTTISKFVKSDNKYYWVTDLPGLPSANLKNMMQMEFNRQSKYYNPEEKLLIPQQTIIWGITNRCHLNCRHCYDWENIDKHEHLSIDQLKHILSKIEEHGIRHVQLSGGEPLARFDDLISILQMAAKKIDFWLLTSGFGLTAEKANALKKAGLTGTNISLDHWNEAKHNDFRNNDKSFNWVMEAVKNCRNAGILVSLSVCATREFVSRENLEEYARLAKSVGANFIRILEPRAVGKFMNQKVHLEKEQIELLGQFMKQMNSDPEYKSFPIVVFFGYHQRNIGCMGAGNRYLYLDSKGEFHACPFCQGSIGNVFSISFNEAISNLRKKGCQAFKTY